MEKGLSPLPFVGLVPLPPSPTYTLATVQAGLLWGQLTNQQGLQELAHEVEVQVEGTKGILESREAAGKAEPQPSAGKMMPSSISAQTQW